MLFYIYIDAHIQLNRKVEGHSLNSVRRLSNLSSEISSVGNASSEKVEKINRAMKAYLERAQAHNVFMAEEIAEFEIGKRHLANMMGADPDAFTQEDVDKAIQYLLPSGIFDKKARPKLKHPEEILPRRKAAQFGLDGRPFDCLFYTGKPNFYQTMHDLTVKLQELRKYEDAQFAKGVKADSAELIQLAGSQWIEKTALESRFQEKLSDSEYNNFIALVDLLAKQPFAVREREYVFQFRSELQVQASTLQIPALLCDENGRSYQDAEGFRKDAKAKVRIYDKGSGVHRVNNRELLDWFPRLADREQVIFPLHFTGKLSFVDFEATVAGGGPSGQAGAVRLGLARALKSFVDKDMVEKLRLAGLLTRDPRVNERQKPGQRGARRKNTWKKR